MAKQNALAQEFFEDVTKGKYLENRVSKMLSEQIMSKVNVYSMLETAMKAAITRHIKANPLASNPAVVKAISVWVRNEVDSRFTDSMWLEDECAEGDAFSEKIAENIRKSLVQHTKARLKAFKFNPKG